MSVSAPSGGSNHGSAAEYWDLSSLSSDWTILSVTALYGVYGMAYFDSLSDPFGSTNTKVGSVATIEWDAAGVVWVSDNAGSSPVNPGDMTLYITGPPPHGGGLSAAESRLDVTYTT